jgi:F0F1-type ATP synthase membrane subunit b/b'
MTEDTKGRFVDVVRTEFERGTDTARRNLERNAQEAREELDRRTDEARDEFGDRVVDMTEEYFPEAVAKRRRKTAAIAFAAGLGVGAVTSLLLRR